MPSGYSFSRWWRTKASRSISRSAERAPSMAESQAMKRQSQKRDHWISKSVDVSKGQRLLLRPKRLRGAKVRWPKASLV